MCVLCFCPGEGAGVGDVAQCGACVAGAASFPYIVDSAIEKCKEAKDADTVRQLRAMKQNMRRLNEKVRSFLSSGECEDCEDAD
jgi:hypothetical protein